MSSYTNNDLKNQFTIIEAIDTLNKTITRKKPNKDIGKEPDEVKNGDLNSSDRFDKFLSALNSLKNNNRVSTPISESIADSGTDNFWDDLARTTSLPESHSPSTTTTTTTINNNYILMSLQDILKQTGLDQYIKETSGYDPNRSNIRSNHRNRDRYGNSMAYDIIPKGDITFQQMLGKIKDNELMVQWLNAHGFNINDETSERAKQVYGATGPHYHIGPDHHEPIYIANQN